MALGLLDIAYDLGLKVPEDLAIVGFDDIFVSALRPIGLTTISFEVENLAELAIYGVQSGMDYTLFQRGRFAREDLKRA